MAVRVGFEPTVPVKVQRFSRPADSTTLAPHRIADIRNPNIHQGCDYFHYTLTQSEAACRGHGDMHRGPLFPRRHGF